MKFSTVILLVSGVLPLSVYPFVALATFMSLAQPAGSQHLGLLIVARSALIASLLYPVIYLCCLVGAFILEKKGSKAAFAVSLAPLVFLGFTGLLFVLWHFVEHGRL